MANSNNILTEEELKKPYTMDYRNKDIMWTASNYDTDSLLPEELPYAYFVEYEQAWSATVSNVDYWIKRLTGSVIQDPYYNLYLGKPTGNTYVLPYFSEQYRSLTQSWSENKAPLGDLSKIGNVATNISKVFLPAAGMVYPRAYTGSTPQTYSIEFTLFNTVNTSDSFNTIRKNKEFIERFYYRNLHGQSNSISITPPSLYEIYIPGVRWSPVASVSNLNIQELGNLNRIQGIARGNYIIPDAWRVQISITELLNESKSIYADAIKGSEFAENMSVKVIAITDESTDESNFRTAGQDAIRAAFKQRQQESESILREISRSNV